MNSPGNGDSLTFTTRQGSHRLIRAAQVDAHLVHLVHGDLIGIVMVKELKWPNAADGFITHEKVARHRH